MKNARLYKHDYKLSEDLKTSACTTPVGSMSKSVKQALSNIHDNVMLKYYGCGLCIPPMLEGCTVLDLVCGSGRDIYAIAQLVCESGNVIGNTKSNVTFKQFLVIPCDSLLNIQFFD